MDFETNRRKILDDLKRQRGRKKVSAGRSASQTPSIDTVYKKHEKERIAVFGQKSLFLNNLQASLQQKFLVDTFFDVDKATDFIVENNIKYVVIDIDPPSDYHLAANLLTVVKSLVAGAIIFVCTKDKDESRARTLFTHGGIIMQKPVSIPDLVDLMTE